MQSGVGEGNLRCRKRRAKTASCFFPLFLSISAKPDLEPQGAAARRGSYFRTFAPCPSRSLRVVPHSEPEAARRAR